MLIFKIFETYYQIASQKDSLHLFLSPAASKSMSVILSDEWAGIENRLAWEGQGNSLESRDVREAGRGLWGRWAGETGSAVPSWAWSHVASSVSARHVETRSPEEGDMKSQRTFVSSRKAEGS